MRSKTRQKKKQRDKRDIIITILIIVIILLLLLLIGSLFLMLKKEKDLHPVEGRRIELDTVKVMVPIRIERAKEKIPEKPPIIIRDTVFIAPDTVDSGAADTIIYDPCEADTVAPWVYPEPSGGLHYGKISVRFVATEPCSIEWKFQDEKDWRLYKKGPIIINKNRVLCFKARDSCGNSMDIRYEQYEIGAPIKKTYCPNDMEYIEIAEIEFCIDRYEWPNKKGVKPMSHISIYHAMDSCYTAGKRLCTTDEWSLACGGSYSWKYPYGDVYEPKACATRDTSVYRSGRRAECRGYFGVYDMSGNLAEWTNTRSKKNRAFFNVMGGFWESGPQSSCFKPRYSYYPENRHNPVGFRCCKEVNKDPQ